MDALTIFQISWLGAAIVVAGGVAGLLAGLFGVGGGTIIVPVLYQVFSLYGLPDEIRMPLCVGTSLAVIVPTSLSSFRAHFRKGLVDTAVLRIWAAPVVLGVILGIAIGAFAPPKLFKIVFIVVSLLLAARLVVEPGKLGIADKLPGRFLLSVYGAVIGVSSALMGIGGGLVANLMLTLYRIPVHAAVATASGVGVFVSIPGAIGYIVSGWGRSGLPPLSLGYVSLIGVALLTPLSIATAKYGAALAHRLEKRQLEIALAVYLCLISLRFITSMT
jgi:uncharacterized membrane protein YfcA